jgi:DNA invertase Pin-like site-specific DNA recombinase
MRAIGYVRVSTDEQLQGNGMELQTEAVMRYCETNDLRLIGVEADAGVSGSADLDKRAGLASALMQLEEGGADVLVVYRLDRLARDFVLQELLVSRLRAAGTPVRSVTEPDVDTDTDDPTKVLIRQILGALAQYERQLIRARMQAGKTIKAARGGYVGGQPRFGSQAVDSELAHDTEEQATIGLIRSLRSQGLSYRAICAELDAAGIPPRRSNTWHPMVVRRIVDRTT